VLENEILNISRPLKSERQKLFECFLINHGHGNFDQQTKQKACKGRRKLEVKRKKCGFL